MTALPRERLDARNGWQTRAAQGLVALADRLELAATRPDGSALPAIADTEPLGSFGGRLPPRGVALSSQGEVYLADPLGSVLYTRADLPPPASGPLAPFTPLWQAPPGDPRALVRPVALALVPADARPGAMADALVVLDGARLLWVDRRTGALRHLRALPGTGSALACDPRGTLWVLVEEGRAALRIDRGQIAGRLALPLQAHTLACAPGALLAAGHRAVVALDGQGRALDPAPHLAALPVAALCRADDHWLSPLGHRLALSLDRRGALRGLPVVTLPSRQPRPRRGDWLAGPFDGGAQGFAWHRIALEAVVPASCRLVVSTFTSDRDALPADPDWATRAAIGPGARPEALVQQHRGQFLWIRIEAFGDGAATPTVTGIDIFGPRDSQVSLLPAPFRADPVTADFLDRFLSLQDEFLAEAEAAFTLMQGILRPDATPPQFIDWLGGWFDWRFLAGWDSATRREMIASSISFFAQRGTLAGLTRMLRWHLGARAPVAVVEGWRLARATEVLLPDGSPRVVWLGGQPASGAGPHRFSVLVPQALVPDDAARATLQAIIAAQAPAHCVFCLLLVPSTVILGVQSTLGADAILPGAAALGQARLGHDLTVSRPLSAQALL